MVGPGSSALLFPYLSGNLSLPSFELFHTSPRIIAGEIGQKSARLGWRFGSATPLLFCPATIVLPAWRPRSVPLPLLPAVQQQQQQHLSGFEQLAGARAAPAVPDVVLSAFVQLPRTLCTPDNLCTPSSRTNKVKRSQERSGRSSPGAPPCI